MNAKKLSLLPFALVLGSVWVPSPSIADDGFQIIANGRIRTTTLSRREVSRMFLKQVRRWPDGTDVKPVDLDPRSATRDAFSRAVHGRGPTAIQSQWRQRLFSGRDVPPPQRDSDAAVIDFVRRTPGAIGYVSASADTGGVRVINLR